CGIAAHCEGVFQAGVVDGAVLAFSPPLDLKILFRNLQVLRLVREHVHNGYVVEGRERYVKRANLGLKEKDLAELDFDSYIKKVAFPYVQSVYPLLLADFPDLKPI